MGLKLFLARQASKPSGWFGRMFAGHLLNIANASLEDMGLRLMDLKPDSRVLEIGFGNGRLISKMGALLDEGRIIGIEISKEMIAKAEKKNMPLIESGKLKLIHSSVELIPVEDDSLDVVFTANTIYFWPEPEENVKEIIRVLKPGGEFYCAIRPREEVAKSKLVQSNLDIFRSLYSKSELVEFLERSGFIEVSLHAEEEKHFTNVIVIGTKGSEL